MENSRWSYGYDSIHGSNIESDTEDRYRGVQQTKGHNISRDVQQTKGHNCSRDVKHRNRQSRSRDVQQTKGHNSSRNVQQTKGHNSSKDVQQRHLNNSSRDIEHTHSDNFSRDYDQHLDNTNASSRNSRRSRGNRRAGHLERSDGSVGGRRALIETSPLLSDDADNNQDHINVDGQKFDEIKPSVKVCTPRTRYVLCVIISAVAVVVAFLTFLICRYTITCKDHDNTTPAHCSPWSSWSQCSATCGIGVQTRTNQCYGNSTQPWQVTFTDSKECAERMCDAYCSPWSSWSLCSVSCGEGVQKRARKCSGNSTKPWQITFTDSVYCTEPICLGKWLPWGAWSGCSKTCGPGLKSRERGCSKSYCGTNNTNVDMCQDEKCTGEWLHWGSWGTCSSTCGWGVRTRERGCSESYCGTNNTCMDSIACDKYVACKGSSFKPWNMGVMIVLLLSIKQLIRVNYT